MFGESNKRSRVVAGLVFCFLLLFAITGTGLAHPLGNFTINHYAKIQVGTERVTIRYVIDMAEIPAFQELQKIGTSGDEELNAYGERMALSYLDGLVLLIDGSRVMLRHTSTKTSTPAGNGGLPTLRIESEFVGALPDSGLGGLRRLRFENANYAERIGWREIVVASEPGTVIFNSSAYGNGVTDELKGYPEDMLSAPLDEKKAELSFSRGAVPQGATFLMSRDGAEIAPSRDRLTELISVPELTPAVALLGLLLASVLGGLHALSPGHGKTVVGAYLVGSRGTARHAAFLGLTVTITHTLGVFALGLVTLFASQYVLPERIFPYLSLVSGAIVVAIGLSIFLKRLRVLKMKKASKEMPGHAHGDQVHSHGHGEHSHEHDHSHAHGDHSHTHSHNKEDAGHSHEGLVHSHGGSTHSHLPPGADGSPVTWRSLLGLGISGGLLPCPSALVVLLSAISLHRVGYGLLLVIAFSLGLAASLTAVGLAFVYLGSFLKDKAGSGRLVQLLPVVSAFVITCAGAVICYEAVANMGADFRAMSSYLIGASDITEGPGSALSSYSVLALGLLLGLKHAVEADHVAAVSTIVSEKKGFISSSIVGGLWGIGHTASLLIAGVAVLLLHIKISDRTALALELGVALMLIALGANAIRKLARSRAVHLHEHNHGLRSHAHLHLHDGSPEPSSDTHHGLRLNVRPVLVGMVHGLAGSAALMLLILSSISSAAVGLGYIALFGIGSIGGMIIMSGLLSLPLRYTAGRFGRANLTMRLLAGIFSIGIGLFMVYEIGFVEGLLI
ncbi:MAG TPA: sulfite exporter TauE/SafE family protein [Blastocatellia bacterium]|nr:sulfite exporter TauE/SafE family protein [Blastocatellia bacterium]